MRPVNFAEATNCLGAPKDADNPSAYGKLPIHTDGEYCTSVWLLSDEDIALINKTRGILIAVRSGKTQHPLRCSVSDSLITEDYIPDDTNEPTPDILVGPISKIITPDGFKKS